LDGRIVRFVQIKSVTIKKRWVECRQGDFSMSVLRDPVAFLDEEYQALVAQDLDWRLRELQGPSTPRCIVEGKEVIMLCSNNYLNLSNHPKLKQAAIEAIRTHGVGSGSVRAIAGNMDLHEELERRLARFKGAEASLVFQTGFAANAGLVPQLAGKGDLIISDELNHGSIIDGVRLSRADRAIYKHCDVADLARTLEEAEKHKPPYRRILVITDGVFSMDGDIAPLDKIAKLCKEHGAILYVDDAHGEGVLGEGGRGIVSHFKLTHKDVHIEILEGIRRGWGPHLGEHGFAPVRPEQGAHMAPKRIPSSTGSRRLHRSYRGAGEGAATRQAALG